MPILQRKRPTKKVTLPESGAVVEFLEKQTYGDFLQIQKASMGKVQIKSQEKKKVQIKNRADLAKINANKDTLNDSQLIEADLSAFMQETLERMIVSWDFTDEDGSPLPVTPENIAFLETADALYLFNEINKSSKTGEDEDAGEDEEARTLKEKK